MSVTLPTDTQHLGLVSRQYELFNVPLGQGVARRVIAAWVLVCLIWWPLLVVVGVGPVSRLGPAVYLVPPFALAYLGTRVGDDGRMTMLRWYDAVLARAPRRRRPLRNPLLDAAQRERPVVRLVVTTELVCPPAVNSGAPCAGRRAGW